MIINDYPEVFSVDSQNSTDLSQWWDTLGDDWVRVNIITDIVGNTVGTSGTSRDLTGGADRIVLTSLRAAADVVVLGGATVRAEPDCIPRSGDVVIVSRSGDIPLDAIKRARGKVTVLHGTDGAAPPATHGVELGPFTGKSIIRAVRKLGYRKIVCEGGANLAKKLLDGNVVNEWCHTASPRLGERGAGLTAPTVTGRLSTIARDSDGFRYTRRVPDGAPQNAI